MTIKKCKDAAYVRGIYFSGKKHWLNNMVGYGYDFYGPDYCGAPLHMTNNLEDAYRLIKQYPRLSKKYLKELREKEEAHFEAIFGADYLKKISAILSI